MPTKTKGPAPGNGAEPSKDASEKPVYSTSAGPDVAKIAGATLADWTHWDLVVGLGSELLPAVADQDAKLSPHSSLKAVDGKTPSEFGPHGVRGIPKWQDLVATEAQLVKWSADRRLNVCLQARTVRALDGDIEDPALAAEVAAVIAKHVKLPKRTRANSSKFLQPFRYGGPLKKRVITTRAGKIELLADGQQWVAAGVHKSGARIEWEGGLPNEIPEVTPKQLDALWSKLEERFSVEPATETATGTAEYSGELLTTITDEQLRDLESALSHPALVEAAGDESVWSKIAHHLLSLGEVGQRLFRQLSNAAPNKGERTSDDWFDDHRGTVPTSDFRSVFTLAAKYGWLNPKAAASRTGDPGFDIARPTIRLTGGDLHIYAEQAERVLADEVYTRGAQLVRIAGASELKGASDGSEESTFDASGIERNKAQAVIIAAPAEFLQRKLTERATFESFDRRAKEWVRKDCPATLARNIALQGDWETFQPLDAVARSPFTRPDASVCTTPGYDRQTGVYYAPNAEFPAIPERPTQKQAADALAVLLAPFEQFPYATPAGSAAFVSHILAEAVRLAVDNTPAYIYAAARAGTGKTLQAEMASRIVHGAEPAKRAWADGDELRKVLFSSLLAGDRSILLDNVPTGSKVRAAPLCGFLTAPVYGDRKLGVSETVAVPNRTVVSFTGNNITAVGDLARRSVVIRLVGPGDTAALRARRFRIPNLKGHVAANRAELLMAALTIVRAFVAAGCPPQSVPLPSFERWSMLARDPLLWLGMEDPVQTQIDETDDESSSAGAVYEVLGPRMAGRPFTASAIVTASEFDDDLRKAIEQSGCGDACNVMQVGYWLRDMRDMEEDGWQLVRVGAESITPKRWRLRKTASDLL